LSSSRFNTAQILEYRQSRAEAQRALQVAMSQSSGAGGDAQAKSATAGGLPAKRSNALPPPSPKDISRVLGVETLTVEWLAGDGSDRCYYRLFSPEREGSMVLMQLSGADAQALKDGGYDWVKIARLLSASGIFVPKVIAAMPDHAALVIEDYGDVMLEGKVFELADKGDSQGIRALYKQASAVVAKFLAIPKDPQASWCKRGFDAERYLWELNFFVQKYVEPVAKITFTPAERQQFAAEAKSLAKTLAADMKWFVHRDFHSRNLMLRGDKLATIDFQDARLGPASYDLVSLCFDSYVPFGAETRREILADGLATIEATVGQDAGKAARALWKPMLLQRQLKAIGSFGFLTIDKQRGDYLKYVDPALKTLEDVELDDARWPLLTGELLKRLRARLPNVPKR
jgi:aminoglycoside/choline kinase family phosphotransferase